MEHLNIMELGSTSGTQLRDLKWCRSHLSASPLKCGAVAGRKGRSYNIIAAGIPLAPTDCVERTLMREKVFTPEYKTKEILIAELQRQKEALMSTE